MARLVALLAIAPLSEWKRTSLPAFVKVETASSGSFTAATWNLIRHRCRSLVVNPNTASPRLGIRPPSAAR
eukprot:8616618-Alexandrium_andersonii.AAC.1